MVIHQIWLGNDLPAKYAAWMQTWQNIEGTTYMLWTDNEVDVYKQDLEFASVSKLHASYKSDLLRDLILRDHGGLYIDTDCERFGDIPDLGTEFKNVMKYDKLGNKEHPDNYMLYAPTHNCQQVLDMIDYGLNKVPRWTNTFFRFGVGPIINLFQDQHSIDIRQWCVHHHSNSWNGHNPQEFRVIPESKGI